MKPVFVELHTQGRPRLVNLEAVQMVESRSTAGTERGCFVYFGGIGLEHEEHMMVDESLARVREIIEDHE